MPKRPNNQGVAKYGARYLGKDLEAFKKDEKGFLSTF
jgi:hypothetical protein